MSGRGESAKAIADQAMAAAAATRPDSLRSLAEDLGVQCEPLRRLRVGFLFPLAAWGFPMTNATGGIIGVRLLTAGGWAALPGGRDGLFLPVGLEPGGRLLVAAGPVNTAALLSLGFRAVGRPSPRGGGRYVVSVAKRLKPVEVAIVPDGDQPGRRAADRLAAALLPHVPIVRVVVPPPGVKDAREWVRGGATAADVHLAIQAPEVKTLH